MTPCANYNTNLNLRRDFLPEFNTKQKCETVLILSSNQNLGDIDPEPWVVFLFYNHPPLNARIAKAQGWEGAS